MAARDNFFSRTPSGRYRLIKYHAKRLGIDLELDRSEYADLIDSPCHYCGFPLAETGRGVDRKDPLLGYTRENTVPCCTECNAYKGDLFTHDEMLIIGEAVRRVKATRPTISRYRRGRRALSTGRP